jgi:phenylalanyl-tRNA synthetase beta chain
MIERVARRTAAARGLNEAVTWSFIAESEAGLFGGAAWLLANPISEEMKAMLGRRYLDDAERPTLGLVLAGDRTGRHWRSGKAASADAFDAKAEALAILAAAGAPVDNLQVLDGDSAVYHPGQSGRLCLGPKNALAEFGALHPRIARAFDLDGPVVAAEIFLDAIPQKRDGIGHMRSAYAPPPLQAVTRDFAFLVPAELPADRLLRAVRGADKAAIVEVSLFDFFTGQGVPEGQKSLAIEVVLQPAEKSFTEEELKTISERIVAAAATLGAVLRG